MKATTLVMTCGACPSQWEGKLEDGRMFYIRYRWGCLSVSVSGSPTDDVGEAVCGNVVLEAEHGGDWDGVLSTEDMQDITKSVMDWSGLHSNNSDHTAV